MPTTPPPAMPPPASTDLRDRADGRDSCPLFRRLRAAVPVGFTPGARAAPADA